ncbi:hypothetical protein PtA15_4A230 [Puccinia triticina]|uniref:Pentacotripeptide-repeat region of PRORP domain-containing protein n=1 Tax=Puccinia triticina TaxID=208348 RepID=A0ABY7CEZ6_9BASI|nr:uncharacterized protein PtA15_4A230 [Puccinia triticina]WAQ83781.1 hypothetical protein PtA15_4A230 [Puccinia triticina]
MSSQPQQDLYSIAGAPWQPTWMNEQLIQLVLTMSCSPDVRQMDEIYHAVRLTIAQRGDLNAEAWAVLIETYGRLGQVGRLREMYGRAQSTLASFSIDERSSTLKKMLRHSWWTRVEERMVIGLAYCGLHNELLVHKTSLHNSGARLSADIYEAIFRSTGKNLQHVMKAFNYFEEAKQNGVQLSTLSCNILLTKLARVRRTSDMLSVYDEMKRSGTPRNARTFETILHELSRSDDKAKAEEVFQEMLLCDDNPRIGTFITMMKLFNQSAKYPNRPKVLYYYDMMIRSKISPNGNAYNLLMEAYGMIAPYDSAGMERVFQAACRDPNVQVTGAHWATILRVKGALEGDLAGAIVQFEQISRTGNGRGIGVGGARQQADGMCYEALFDGFVACNRGDLAYPYVERMQEDGVLMTAELANKLMKLFASSGQVDKAREIFEAFVDCPPPAQDGLNSYPRPNLTPSLPASNQQRHADRSVYHQQSACRKRLCYETMIAIEFNAGDHEPGCGGMITIWAMAKDLWGACELGKECSLEATERARCSPHREQQRLPGELSELLKDIRAALDRLDTVQPTQLKTHTQTTDAFDAITSEIKQELSRIASQLDELELLADEAEDEASRTHALKTVEDHRNQATGLRGSFRTISLDVKRALSNSTLESARAELLSGATPKTGRSSNTHDALISASSDVTQSLRNTLEIMRQELDRSVMSTHLLD